MDLKEQADKSSVLVPLPLTFPEFYAWLNCAADDDEEGDVYQKDETLIKALKAADFLHDTKTTSAISRNLIRSIIGHGDPWRPLPAVTKDRCAAAAQIVSDVPSQCLHGILAEIDRHHNYGPVTYVYPPVHSLQPDDTQLSRLVQLLPRSFHPAILLACCQRDSIHGSLSLSIPRMPPCNETCPQQCFLCTPDCASILFQLVAAAAALAGGSVERAWAADGVSQLISCDGRAGGPSGRSSIADAVMASARERDDAGQLEHVSKRVCARQENAARATTNNPATCTQNDQQKTTQLAAPLTELALVTSGVTVMCVGAKPPTPESARWCAAIAELRTLRVLSVQSVDAEHLRPRELAAALRRLPALHELSIICDYPPVQELGTGLYKSMAHLFGTVAALTQLSALAVVNCLYCAPRCDDRDDVGAHEYTPLREVAHLSRLTGLTSLSICTEVMGRDGNEMLVHAVKQMGGLRELEVHQNCVFGQEQVVATPVLQLCAATELTALRSVSFPRLCMRLGGLCDVSRFHMNLCRNSPLVARLSALDLNGGFIRTTQCESMAALLAALPALESLRLGDNLFGDTGLVALAPAFALMPKLSALAIDRNDASNVGVFAVMRAMAGARGGGPGLKELDISDNKMGPEHAAELAGLLGQLRDIEVFNMYLVGIWDRALLPVVKAAEGLPRLQALGLFGCARMFNRDHIGDLLDGLGHVRLS